MVRLLRHHLIEIEQTQPHGVLEMSVTMGAQGCAFHWPPAELTCPFEKLPLRASNMPSFPCISARCKKRICLAYRDGGAPMFIICCNILAEY